MESNGRARMGLPHEWVGEPRAMTKQVCEIKKETVRQRKQKKKEYRIIPQPLDRCVRHRRKSRYEYSRSMARIGYQMSMCVLR